MSNLERIKELDAEIDRLKEERNLLVQAEAEAICPFKVGDIATLASHSFRGKKGKITRIFGRFDWKGRFEWAVRAKVLKLDGTEGMNEVDFDQWQHESRVSEAASGRIR
jgi:hypothetical protein